MPQWRKLHVKAVESRDINDMPDDFTRLLWLLMPLGVDREGRGIDDSSWVRSKMMPMRRDVTFEMIEAALAWFSERGMISRYEVDGARYFCIPTFAEYQGKTDREAASKIPAPVLRKTKKGLALVTNNSRPTQELVTSKSGLDAEVDAEVEERKKNNGAEVPAPPPPEVPTPNETVKPDPAGPLSVGQREFLSAFSAKRFKTNVQREAVLALEKTHGTARLKECIAWAAKRGMGLGEAVGAIETAIPTWGKRKVNGNANGTHSNSRSAGGEVPAGKSEEQRARDRQLRAERDARRAEPAGG